MIWARLKGWLAALGAALAVVLAAYFHGRRSGAADQMVQDAEETAERVERGREALRDGRDAGDPDERLRRNDGRW
jgi:hypothetical protein